MSRSPARHDAMRQLSADGTHPDSINHYIKTNKKADGVVLGGPSYREHMGVSINVESLPPFTLFETKNQPPDKFPGTENYDPLLAKQGKECVKEGSINPMPDTDMTDIPLNLSIPSDPQSSKSDSPGYYTSDPNERLLSAENCHKEIDGI